jgi:DNA-3-methyladenine glycosylase II|tara:strand:- start:72 stop:656 length:585 start_codon:yes stop_codon:yes gene_type:complete
MESKKALKSLIEIAKNKKFEALNEHLLNTQPITINLSSLNFVHYLVSVVVSQQLSTKSARTIWLRVMPLLDKPLASKNFKENLREAGLSGPKTQYVVGLLNNKELALVDRKKLLNMSAEDFQTLLLANKGIGPWSVQMARMFFLGDPDILPLNDLGIKHAHQNLFRGHPMNENFYEQFSPWRTYLSLIMWRSLS